MEFYHETSNYIGSIYTNLPLSDVNNSAMVIECGGPVRLQGGVNSVTVPKTAFSVDNTADILAIKNDIGVGTLCKRDNVVTLTDNQILTNKTIDSASNTITVTNSPLSAVNVNNIINQDLRTTADVSFKSVAAVGLKDSAPVTPGVYIGLDSSNNPGIEICGANSTSTAYVDFSYQPNDYKGRISYANTTGRMSFNVNTSVNPLSLTISNIECNKYLQFPASTQPDFRITSIDPWIDIPAPITVRGSGVNNPAWTTWNAGNMYAYEFDGTLTKEVWSEVHMPHSIAPGTGLYFHVHLTNGTAGGTTGNVRIYFEYSYASSNNSFGATATASANITFTAAGQHRIAETGQLLFGSLEVDGLALLRIYRNPADAADTYPTSVWLLMADCHTQISKIGTLNRNKNGGSFYT
jgi:hypothetical protein